MATKAAAVTGPTDGMVRSLFTSASDSANTSSCSSASATFLLTNHVRGGQPLHPISSFTVCRQPLKGAPRRREVEALLLIDLSDSTLKTDLGSKASIYAKAKVPEYWVIDLKAKKTVVHLSPKGSKYTRTQRVPWSSPLASSAVPGLTVTLSMVLW